MSRISDFFNRERDRLLEDTQEAIFSAGETLKTRAEARLSPSQIKGYPIVRSSGQPPAYFVRAFGVITGEENHDYLIRTTTGLARDFPRIRTRSDWERQKQKLDSPRLVGNQHGTFIVVSVNGRRRAVYEVPSERTNFERWFYSEAEKIANQI